LTYPSERKSSPQKGHEEGQEKQGRGGAKTEEEAELFRVQFAFTLRRKGEGQKVNLPVGAGE